ncbi:MAG: helix-turn-helix transcriptional regulator [Ruminococcaceae bacterium]|nr:helix-turn-helix transcriptional regulator [Oscillospiraceae bacterium]
MKFNDKLRMLIEEKELTQRELATQLKIPVSTLGGYVQGTSEPDFQTLVLFADFFNVSTDFLLNHTLTSEKADNEDDLLRVYRSLTPLQQEIYLEQGKAIMKFNK